LLTDSDGYPKLAGLNWPERLERFTPLSPTSAGSKASQEAIDTVIVESEGMHAFTKKEFDQSLARFKAAATRSQSMEEAPVPVGREERREILAQEDAAGRVMNDLRLRLENEARALNYWKSIKPVNDELTIAIAERDKAVARYNRRLFSAPLDEHLSITIDAIEAHARVRGLQTRVNAILIEAQSTTAAATGGAAGPAAGGASAAAGSATAASTGGTAATASGTGGPRSPFAITVGGVVGVANGGLM
jgi:hypothetical protein